MQGLMSGGGASFTKELLWTNSTQTSSFAAQTISLNMKKWTIIEIVVSHNNDSGSPESNEFAQKGVTAYLAAARGNRATCRSVLFNDTGIQIGIGFYSDETSPIWCIPKRIYGII